MNLNNVSLVISAVRPAQYPAVDMPEVAFAGRSNVGKSSLINTLLRRKSFARVSASPGKTATLNFYNIDDVMHIVDLPGYGFAKVSKAERERWGAMIDRYLTGRQQLRTIIQLIDSRHKPTADDVTMINWIRQAGYHPIVVATKIDKLKKSEIEQNLSVIKEVLVVDDLIPFSSKTGTGRDEIWGSIKEHALI